jgi:hypothetical protein
MRLARAAQALPVPLSNRNIANLARVEENISSSHLTEALGYQRVDREKSRHAA